MREIYIPHVQFVCAKEGLDYSSKQRTMLLLDSYSVHKFEAFEQRMADNNYPIRYICCSCNCTSKLQPCDVV